MASSWADRVWSALGAILGLSIVLGPALFLGARLLEGQHATAHSLNATAWLLTREIAPGDDVALRVQSHGGRRSWIHELRAQVGSLEERTIWTPGRDDEDSVHVVLAIPADAPLGPMTIVLDVDVQLHVETGRDFGIVYQRMETRRETLEIPLVVRSEKVRTLRVLVFRVLAVVAWIAAWFAAYPVARWCLGGPRPGATTVSDAKLSWLVLLCFFLAILLAVLGQLVFVRPIQRTTAVCGLPFLLGLQATWIVALLLGGWRGLRARARDHRWKPGRLRAVVGKPRAVAYREAGSTLPAMLSREAPRRDAASVLATLRDLGCDVQMKGRTMHVSLDGEPVMRLRTRTPSPWLPEELEPWVLDGIHAEPLLAELTKLYGPLEYRPFSGAPTILEVPE